MVALISGSGPLAPKPEVTALADLLPIALARLAPIAFAGSPGEEACATPVRTAVRRYPITQSAEVEND